MKDTAKGAAHMEKRARELLPGITIFPRMGGFYYTTPSAVKNPVLFMNTFDAKKIMSGVVSSFLMTFLRC